ncbi:MAG: phage tail protein [Caldilineaceae bacterium]
MSTSSGQSSSSSSASTSTSASSERAPDVLPSFAFRVQVEGVDVAAFTTVSGLSFTRKVEEQREGGANDSTFWKPGQMQFGKVTLERGMAFSNVMWDWFIAGAADGKVTLKDVTVHQFVPYAKTAAREFHLLGCMATSWTGPTFSAAGNDVTIEKLELAFRRFEVKAPASGGT